MLGSRVDIRKQEKSVREQTAAAISVVSCSEAMPGHALNLKHQVANDNMLSATDILHFRQLTRLPWSSGVETGTHCRLMELDLNRLITGTHSSTCQSGSFYLLLLARDSAAAAAAAAEYNTS